MNSKKLAQKSALCFVVMLAFILSPAIGNSQNVTRIACVGNSITFGANIDNRKSNSYPAQLEAMLGERYEVRNFEKNGATLLRKGDISYWNSREYRQALDYRPDWVFIDLGTNDSKLVNRAFLSEYEEDYKDLISSFQKLESHPRIVLLIPTPVFSTDTSGITSAVLTEKIIPMVRNVAYETHCEAINLYNLLIESPHLFLDKVHPSKAGTTVIAQRLAELVLMKSEESNRLLKELPDEAKPINFYGYEGYDFIFRNRDAKIVLPKRTAPGHPWVWRARFWGHEPQTDIALLERGFHVVYYDVAEMFANEESLTIWDDYYQFLFNAGLSTKAVMEGMSRGGVYVYRWAARYPERVAAIYADAPVLDLKSWPGGKGQSKGSPEDWETFKKDFNFKTEDEAIAFKGNPLDLISLIAGAGFPMLHVVGDADDIVPVAENTLPFEQKIKAEGGSIQVIHKPEVGHHPHSLQNPQPIVDFILKASKYSFPMIQHNKAKKLSRLPSAGRLLKKAIVSEGNQDRLQSVFTKARKGEKVVVGVLGGSITAGAAASEPDKRYANVILAWWKKAFPNTEFELVNAGIGATDTDYGSMRAKRDLLSKSPDFVILEYACNDANTQEYAESYEGVVRQILKASSMPALLLLFMTNRDRTTAQEWESKIGFHYGLPMISFQDAIWSEIQAGRVQWDQVSPDEVHPNDAGHKLTGELVCGWLEKANKKFSPPQIPAVSEVIPSPLISDTFEFTSLYDGEALVPIANQNWVFDGSQKRSAGWKSSIPGSVIEFEINEKQIYLSCWTIQGPMGKVSAKVDGGEPVIIDAWFDQTWGGYRHMVRIGKNLPEGKHTVRIELLSEKNDQSTGNDFRILCLGSAGV